MLKNLLGVLIGTLVTSSLGAAALASASDDAAKGAWERIGDIPGDVLSQTPWVRPSSFVAFQSDLDALRAILGEAPREGKGGLPLRVTIPLADGTLGRFDLVNSRMMDEALEAKYPLIRTYVGQGVDDPHATVHVTIDHRGFHAQVLSLSGTSCVDPVTADNGFYYAAYVPEQQTPIPSSWRCLTEEGEMHAPGYGDRGIVPGVTGAERRDYRLVMMTTGEYTARVSAPAAPNVAAGLASVVDLMNRCNQIYERDLSLRMVLVANTDTAIFTNAATDPIQSPANATSSNTDLCGWVSTNIGESNYDAAHVVHFIPIGSEQGLAGDIGTICRNDRSGIVVGGNFPGAIKGTGYSGGDPLGANGYLVSLVAHEMGHGFGMWHCMASCFGGQAGAANAALEPGSGSTIMSYAGICSDSNNLQPRADNMYGYAGYRDAVAYLATHVCGTPTTTGNHPPAADAGPAFTIPAKTPFFLTGRGEDVDGDALSYSWENVNYDSASPVNWPVLPNSTTTDRGTTAAPTATTDGGNPLVRVRLPVASPTRTINPSIVNGGYPGPIGNPPNPTAGEALPQVSRNMRWRLVVRDNHASSGGIATDEVLLSVVGSAGPFAVTAPAAGAVTEGQTTVTWNVANTNVAPVSCSEVRILVSEDNGVTWPYVVADRVPNTGSAVVLMPNINVTSARLRVQAVDNIFFSNNPGTFTINFVPPGVVLTSGGASTFSDSSGNGNSNNMIDPGERDIAINVPVRNAGATTATNITASLESLTPGVTVTSATSSYPDLPYTQSRPNNTPFRVAVGSGVTCGSVLNFRLNVSSPQNTAAIDFSFPTGYDGGTSVYSAGRRPIPDNNLNGVLIPLTVSNIPVNVQDLVFRINGTACSNASGSTTVGLAHNAVNQLRLSLINPAGTEVVLWDGNGGAGRNLCNTVFDDTASTSVTSLTSANAPYVGTFRPLNPLSAFRGGPANGVWNLRVVDFTSGTGGSLLSYSLIIRAERALCTPPLPSCIADTDDGSGTGVPDGGVTIDDLLYYLVIYANGSTRADVDDGSGNGVPDGGVTIDDLLYYLARYAAGC